MSIFMLLLSNENPGPGNESGVRGQLVQTLVDRRAAKARRTLFFMF
jgi:hypothetical protein